MSAPRALLLLGFSGTFQAATESCHPTRSRMVGRKRIRSETYRLFRPAGWRRSQTYVIRRPHFGQLKISGGSSGIGSPGVLSFFGSRQSVTVLLYDLAAVLEILRLQHCGFSFGHRARVCIHARRTIHHHGLRSAIAKPVRIMMQPKMAAISGPDPATTELRTTLRLSAGWP